MSYRIVLIGCGSNKIVTSGPVTARDLYTSNYFDLKSQYAEQADLGYVLSAKHGLIHLDEAVETYEATMDDVERELWAAEVNAHLARIVELKIFADEVGSVEVEILAGRDYVEPLRELLEWGDAYTARFPFDDTDGIGDQMGWLAEQIQEGSA